MKRTYILNTEWTILEIEDGKVRVKGRVLLDGQPFEIFGEATSPWLEVGDKLGAPLAFTCEGLTLPKSLTGL